MRFKTGDILIWRSTKFYDSLGENTIQLPGYHAGVILVGKKISKLSTCGESPSSTYITFLVDKIFPIEEVIGYVWCKPNGSSLHLIERMTGRQISEKETYDVLKDFLCLVKRSKFDTVYIAVAAYFRFGGISPETGHEKKRFGFCPATVSYFLDRFGFIRKDAVMNNLLPMDFYEKRFYQIEEYRRIDIFDKHTRDCGWLFMTPLIRWGFVKPRICRCPVVDKILSDYDYPRIKNSNHV